VKSKKDGNYHPKWFERDEGGYGAAAANPLSY
jgi:hypothetical protein